MRLRPRYGLWPINFGAKPKPAATSPASQPSTDPGPKSRKTLVYVAPSSGAGDGWNPAISASGRFVTFEAFDAENLSSEDTDGINNVFVRDVLGAAPVSSAPPQLAGSAVVGGVVRGAE